MPVRVRALVIGVGNPLMSDDGLGQRLLEAVAARSPALEGVEYLDAGTLGLLLLSRIESCDALLALDAAQLDAEPGTVRVFEGEALDAFVRVPHCSAHELGLRDLLDAARLTGCLPAQRALVCVQPGWLDLGMSLSPAVAAALPAAADAARQLLQDWLAAAGS